MIKRVGIAVVVLSLIPVLSGCLALLAGAGGTAFWQAGKIISEETVSMERAVAAVESAFKAHKITLTEKVTKTQAAQLRGEDSANKRVAVDVISKGDNQVRLEIRYGIAEEEPARELLNDIKNRL